MTWSSRTHTWLAGRAYARQTVRPLAEPLRGSGGRFEPYWTIPDPFTARCHPPGPVGRRRLMPESPRSR